MSPSVSRFTSPLRNNAKWSQGAKDGAAEAGGTGGGPEGGKPNANSPATNSPDDNSNTHGSNIYNNTLISATLNEALRNNPFGNTSRSRAVEAEAEAQAQPARRTLEECRQHDLDDLNRSLMVLAQLFPDVRVEVFRELLTRFDGQSRLHVCVEQLLRHKKQWVQGRWNVPHEKSDGGGGGSISEGKELGQQGLLLTPEELFRSETYKGTVKAVLCKEFGGLSRSTIEGVLAEVNFSYVRARPTLRELSQKSWRATIINLNPFKRKKDKDDNPLVVWERCKYGGATSDGLPLLSPRIKRTGSDELDQEIHEAYIAPLLREQKETQEYQDYCFATGLNEKEAMAENALYECQCCLDDVAFEQISACCSSESHIICFNCIRRTLHEAAFGQGWEKSVDPERSTLKCVAPMSHGVCEGYLDPMVVKRAILSEKAGFETYRKFEDRLASEALLKTNLKLIRCPFCSYAEIDPVFHPSSCSSFNSKTGRGNLRWRFRRDRTLLSTIVTTIILLDLIPVLLLPFLILLLLYPQTATTLFHNSLQNLCLRSRSQRFPCKNPTCLQVSCMTCRQRWRDPHTCEEPLQQSLRTTVEAARTAAVKRTCPRCNLSFVKSSGCNKLTCVCGYSMCYICRKALNPPSSSFFSLDDPDGAAAGTAGADADQSGYKHFCEHFRVNPGTRCTECNKCELYFAEDEEAIARKAGEKAEREWRLRQSILANNNNNTISNSIHNHNNKNIANNLKSRKNQNDIYYDNNIINNYNTNYSYNSRITAATYNHFNRSAWHYWLVDIWQEKDRWKWEIQNFSDTLVERIVVVLIDEDYAA